MSTTSIAVERNKLAKHVPAEKSKVVKVPQETVKKTKINFFMHVICSEILETAKTVLIIFTVLAMCKLAGIYDWWIHLVGNV